MLLRRICIGRALEPVNFPYSILEPLTEVLEVLEVLWRMRPKHRATIVLVELGNEPKGKML